MFGVEFRRDARTRVRGSARSRTLLPGGDVLTVATISLLARRRLCRLDEGLRAERVCATRWPSTRSTATTRSRRHTFYETIHDQLVNAFENRPLPHALDVSNGGWVGTRGMGLRVARRFGDAVHGSMTYTYGHSWRPEASPRIRLLAFRQGDFHDVAARVETMIEGTDTRVIAFCRVNRLASRGAPGAGG